MEAAEEPAVMEAVPLMKPVLSGRTSEPVPGQYYQTADGRMLMCIRAYPTTFWFINALEDPITVLTDQELSAEPVTAIDLVPSRPGAGR
jgi:hypothetical protein